MQYISTRNSNKRYTLTEAIQQGLASDGGLFIPESFPKIDLADYNIEMSYIEFSEMLLKQYFKEDKLNFKLKEICKNAFCFPVPTVKINHNVEMLDLCKGPTLSFKDFGAKFLAECVNHISTNKKSTIMVATSGDTGSAVASAFYKKENTQVIVLFPKGKISKKQEKQITCWGKNILPLAVHGTFDDCQRLVKQAFQENWWQHTMNISSANSINIGRLLPQMTYYAYTSFQYYFKNNKPVGFIVPTGNLGNATAAFWAKEMGFPIREISLSTNANRVISDYLDSGIFSPRTSLTTLANAMDVGNPSNFERLTKLFPEKENFLKNISAISVSDDQIEQTIINIYNKYDKIICPHTATAFFAKEYKSDDSWIVVSTADPCKFDDIIEPIIRKKIPIPQQMQELLNKETKNWEVQADLKDIEEISRQYFF
ncbi:threonine synthase [Fluviispira multicolorata]|uniref:Threonine synthase n=1 Tax=Fluviispira multicolorata TaxID=2654512 RepID=A0A833JFD9_9BACT|nr:threonine synthase [Fluviispira multicolorata]KAB8033696.1 threonine synthase [Fluviispira multicolorata]